ncbi:MAG: hypothetical protein ACRBBR_11815 [Cellvibrionaceae bacterium]
MSAQAQAAPTQALDLSLVEPADIILTTSDTMTSGGIRGITCGPFSHAILALKNGDCIEATPKSGVQIRSLPFALRKASHAVLYRHKTMTTEYAAWVCHYAKEQKGKGYDKFGAIRSAASTGCGGAYQATKIGYMVELIHETTQKREHNNTFFCSELIASAFEKALIPLLNKIPSHAMTPTAIATSNKLKLVKELITS